MTGRLVEVMVRCGPKSTPEDRKGVGLLLLKGNLSLQ
jgi:hypothetical protein